MTAQANAQYEAALRLAIARAIEKWHAMTFVSHFQAVEQLRDMVHAELLLVVRKHEEEHTTAINGLLDTIIEKQNQLTALLRGGAR